MLIVSDVKKNGKDDEQAEKKLFGIEKLNVPRSDIPAVPHVDTLLVFRLFTGIPIRATMTSFPSLSARPDVLLSSIPASMCAANLLFTPEDAFRCFMIDIEVLVVGNAYLRKGSRPEPCLRL